MSPELSWFNAVSISGIIKETLASPAQRQADDHMSLGFTSITNFFPLWNIFLKFIFIISMTLAVKTWRVLVGVRTPKLNFYFTSGKKTSNVNNNNHKNDFLIRSVEYYDSLQKIPKKKYLFTYVTQLRPGGLSCGLLSGDATRLQTYTVGEQHV